MLPTDPTFEMWPRQEARVIYFGDPSWGFTDAAVPKLRELFQSTNLRVDIDHSGLMIACIGEDRGSQFAEGLALVRRASSMPEFQNCVVGTAGGEIEGPFDLLPIKAAAMRSATKD